MSAEPCPPAARTRLRTERYILPFSDIYLKDLLLTGLKPRPCNDLEDLASNASVVAVLKEWKARELDDDTRHADLRLVFGPDRRCWLNIRGLMVRNLASSGSARSKHQFAEDDTVRTARERIIEAWSATVSTLAESTSVPEDNSSNRQINKTFKFEVLSGLLLTAFDDLQENRHGWFHKLLGGQVVRQFAATNGGLEDSNSDAASNPQEAAKSCEISGIRKRGRPPVRWKGKKRLSRREENALGLQSYFRTLDDQASGSGTAGPDLTSIGGDIVGKFSPEVIPTPNSGTPARHPYSPSAPTASREQSIKEQGSYLRSPPSSVQPQDESPPCSTADKSVPPEALQRIIRTISLVANLGEMLVTPHMVERDYYTLGKILSGYINVRDECEKTVTELEAKKQQLTIM